jgi:hypothetical protein
MRYKGSPAELVDYLFDFGNSKQRAAWKKLLYRLLYKRTLDLIEKILSRLQAEEWGRQFKKLVIFTSWLLPYTCQATLFDRTTAKGGLPS